MNQVTTRNNARVYCGMPGRIEGPGGPIRGVVRNLSRGGTFFLAGQLLPVGQQFELRIDLPGIAPIKAMGEVRYHYRYAEGEGMGIRFVRMAGDDLGFVSQFVNARIGNA